MIYEVRRSNIKTLNKMKEGEEIKGKHKFITFIE